jgi:tetratricopeptide (TPR) repeat protein
MIERLLEADRLLALGLTDQAERIYLQAVETDPRNAIAVVGLARVASERGDDRTALEFARKARAIDPENPAAVRLTARLAEIIATREEQAAAADAADAAHTAVAADAGATAPEAAATDETAPAAATDETTPAAAADAAGSVARPLASAGAAPAAKAKARQKKRRGLIGRLLGGR